MRPPRTQRGARFVRRMWKADIRHKCAHDTCVICQEEYLESNQPIIVLACDHVLHDHCMTRHTEQYIKGIPGIMPESLEELLTCCGAPCPLCRLEYPLRHHMAFYVLNDLTKIPSLEKMLKRR